MRNCIHLVMDFGRGQSIRDEYFTLEKERRWAQLFMDIRVKSSGYDYSFDESKSVKNRDLNRYRDVNPYDHSRVRLRRGNCDYINASFVKVPDAGREYILTQGPLSTTTSHFWLMVWECSSKAIVMLNNIMERNQVKCHTYWPLGSHHGSVLTFPDVQLSVELLSEMYCGNYILRNFKLTDHESNESRIIDQFHYTAWPDFGVPSTSTDFLQFLQDVRNSGGLGSDTNENPVGPAIVHCSAGIGRSGTFCLVDSVLIMLEKDTPVNMKDLVLEMRRYRPGLIQTAEQLRFSYLAVMEGSLKLPANGTGALGNLLGADKTSPEEDGNSSEFSESESDEGDEELDSEEIEEEDSEEAAEEPEGPPPLPPRGESLGNTNYDKPLPEPPAGTKRSRSDVETSDTEASELETEPAAAESSEQSGSELERKRRKENAPDEAIPRTVVEPEVTVRQRRQERAERTQQLVTSIKEKQRLVEQWQHRKNMFVRNFKWIGVGVGLVICATVGFRYFH